MDRTDLPARPRVYSQMEIARPSFAFSAEVGPHLPTPKDGRLSWPRHRSSEYKLQSLPRTATWQISQYFELMKLLDSLGKWVHTASPQQLPERAEVKR